jgi:hypothetical protein
MKPGNPLAMLHCRVPIPADRMYPQDEGIARSRQTPDVGVFLLPFLSLMFAILH